MVAESTRRIDDGDCCECGAGGVGAQALAGFEGELGEGGAEQERHDGVDEEVDAQRLHAGDEVGAAALVREAEDDQGGDASRWRCWRGRGRLRRR